MSREENINEKEDNDIWLESVEWEEQQLRVLQQYKLT